MTDHVATIGALADVCRAKGVREVELLNDAGLRVRLVLGPVIDVPLKPETKGATEPDVCACGCPLAGHMGGMCVTAGCSPEKCAEKKA